MEYRVYKLKLPKEEEELLLAQLFEAGALGAQEEEGFLTVYFPQEKELPKQFSPYLLKEELLPEQDWNSEWKKHYSPVRVAPNLFVVPSWLKGEFKEPENAVVIYIYPGRGFGTGTHETTKLTMRLMLETVKEGHSLLDVGCGSGILSILAKKLGADPVVACDVQPNLREEIERNQLLNGVSFKFVEGSVDAVEGDFSVVVSNIEKHHLEPLLPQIYEKTRKFAVLSGILKSQSREFKERLKEVGFKLERETGEGEWTAYLVRK